MAKRTTKPANSNELDGKEFFAAIAQIEQEKGIKPGYLMEKITQALLSAYRRDHEGVGDNLVIDADPDTCTVRLFLKKDIVEEVDNPATEISLEEARLVLPQAQLGDVVRMEIKPKNFGRVAAQTARQVIVQGLPTGLQNSVISIGNLVVQSNINTFGAFAISGQGAFAKLEGIAFLPIMSMSMALTTFVSQNLGAGRADRAKKGSAIGLAFGMVMAELVGICLFIWIPILLRIFVDAPEAIRFGTIHGRTVALFFFLLAFSNCASGVLRGAGKSVVPMFTMLICWCGIRVLYVTIALRIIPVFRTISSAYPLTWSLSSIIFIVFLLRMDWEKQI